MKKAFRAAVVAAAILFALTFIGSAKLKDESAHLLFSSSVDIGGGAAREIRLKKGDRIALGSYLGEPIIWRVVDTGDRAWLNSRDGFLSTDNFSAAELALISADKNGDTVFLPSKDMLKNISAADRRKSPTEQCVKNDASRYFVLRRYCWYWTSSPVSTNQSSVAAVTTTGGFYKTLAADELCGVCPAIYLRADTLTLCGSGAAENPYALAGGEQR